MKENLLLYPDYEKMSEGISSEILRVIRENPQAAIVLATGHSPELGYRKAVRRILDEKIDVSGVTWIKLDEWLGLRPDDEATCEYFIQKEIVGPLSVSEDRYLHFSLDAGDTDLECARFQAAYDALPKVDLVILGIGMNGHLGLNEPGEHLDAHFHAIGLDPITKTHAMLSLTEKTVNAGVSMGMADIFRGEEILLAADGAKKEAGLAGYLSGEITPKCPVSFLQMHRNVKCFVNLESFKEMRF